MKIYISGKITGLPVAEARAIFAGFEQQINASGHVAVNPMKLKHDHDQAWESFMKVDIAELMTCDAIYLMKDWHESKGACIEHTLATYLGIQVYFEYFTPINELPNPVPCDLWPDNEVHGSFAC